MKILLLCWRDSTHPLGGGSERYLEHVGEYLAAQGHDVVFFSAAHTESHRRVTRDGIRFFRAGGKYTVYPAAWAFILAGRLGIGPAKDIDAVVDTQNGIPFFARIAANSPTVLLTHHCHRDQWPVAGPLIGRFGWLLESRIAPWVYKGAQYVTVSGASSKDLINLGVPSENITIVTNGIDPLPKKVPVLVDDNRRHLLTLSRLVPNKQIEHAMDALESQDDDVVLDVVGSGWWEEKLREYAKERGLSDRVEFYGQVTEDYKHALLARAALHLMPSIKEGWGLAVIEAAQHGVPTIGYSHAGGLQDSILDGETGVLVDSPEELAHVARVLLDDNAERARLGDGALKWSKEFSWNDTGQRFERVLTAAVAKHKRQGEIPGMH